MARIKSSCNLSEKHQKMMEFEKKHFQNQLPYYNDSPTIDCLCESHWNEDPTLAKIGRPSTRRNPKDLPPPKEIIKPRPITEGRITRVKSEKVKKSISIDQRAYSSSISSSCHSTAKKKINPIKSTLKTSGSLSTRSNESYEKNKVSNKGSRRSVSLSSRSETQIEQNENDDVISLTTSPSTKSGTKDYKNHKVEEHEYLLFLLRVTEDIIMNNYYTNEDIERVFKEHMAINKNTLNKEKMEQHLVKLADELHIMDNQTNFTPENISPLSKPAYTNIQTLKTCQCECEPDVPMDVYFYDDNNQNYRNNLDEIIYYRHSLGRLTEYTEPTSSTTKELSSGHKKSDSLILENGELYESEQKLYDTRSEFLNLKRNNSQDSLSSIKILRQAMSDNIVHQKNNLMDNDVETETNDEKVSKRNIIREKSISNNNQNISVVEEDSCNEEKDYGREKEEEEINEKTDKYKTCKSGSKSDSYSEINMCNDGIERINTEICVVEKSKEDLNADSIDNKIITNEINTDKSGFSSESTDKYDQTEKFRTKRTKIRPETTNQISKKDYNSEYSDFATEKSEINAESSDLNTEKVSTSAASLNSEKEIVENKEIITEKEEFKGYFLEDFKLEQNASTTKLHNSDLRLNLDFAKDSIESIVPSPYKTSKSTECIEMNKFIFNSRENHMDNRSYTLIPSQHAEINKSPQTSSHQLYAEPKTENNCTRMSYKSAQTSPHQLCEETNNCTQMSYKSAQASSHKLYAEPKTENNSTQMLYKSAETPSNQLCAEPNNCTQMSSHQLCAETNNCTQTSYKSAQTSSHKLCAENKCTQMSYESAQTSSHQLCAETKCTQMSYKSAQTSSHQMCAETKTENKCTQMSYKSSHQLCAETKTENKCTQMSCTYSSIACCTDDVPVDNSEYVLITSPVYVLKSVLNSRSKIIIEKSNFDGTNEVEDVENQSDSELEVNAEDIKLLGSDYDLTPERDTTSLLTEVSTSTAHIRIPSLTSIKEERLLLGDLYDLHDNSSREFELNKDFETGSATYRCIDTPKALSCDDDIFLRNSEIVVTKNWLSDKDEMQRPLQKKRVNKLKHVRASVNVCSSNSSASLTC